MTERSRRVRRSAAALGVVVAAPVAATAIASEPHAAPTSLGDDTWFSTTMESLFGYCPEWLLQPFLGTPVWRFIAAAAVVLTALILRALIVQPILRRLARRAEGTETTVDDTLVTALRPSVALFIVFTGVWLAARLLVLPAGLLSALALAYRISVIVLIAAALTRSSKIVTQGLAVAAGKTSSEFDDRVAALLSQCLKGVIVAVTAVIVMQEFGFNAAAVLGAFGLGALAVALAAEQTFANWFGTLMIYTDNPFDVGDIIKTPNVEGVVEEVGFRSTKVRTFEKTIVSVPNAMLAGSAIENFSRRQQRRVKYGLQVSYRTDTARVRAALAAIRRVLVAQAGVQQDNFEVRLAQLADGALEILVQYFTDSDDWTRYVEIREAVHLGVLDALAETGVELAAPVRRQETVVAPPAPNPPAKKEESAPPNVGESSAPTPE